MLTNRRNRRAHRPIFECLERRALLSGTTWHSDWFVPGNGITASGPTEISAANATAHVSDVPSSITLSGAAYSVSTSDYPDSKMGSDFTRHGTATALVTVDGTLNGTAEWANVQARTAIVSGAVDRYTPNYPLQMDGQVQIRKGCSLIDISGEGDVSFDFMAMVTSSYRQVYQSRYGSVHEETSFDESALTLLTVAASGKFHIVITVDAGRSEWDNMRLKDSLSGFADESWYAHQSSAKLVATIESTGAHTVTGTSFEVTTSRFSANDVVLPNTVMIEGDTTFTEYNFTGAVKSEITAGAELTHYLSKGVVYARANDATGFVTVTAAWALGTMRYSASAHDSVNPADEKLGVVNFGSLDVGASFDVYRPYYSSPTRETRDQVFAELDKNLIEFETCGVL